MSGARTPLDALGDPIFVLGEELHNSSAFTSKKGFFILLLLLFSLAAAAAPSVPGVGAGIGRWGLAPAVLCLLLQPELLSIPSISHSTKDPPDHEGDPKASESGMESEEGNASSG